MRLSKEAPFWNEEKARKIIRGCVRRKIGMFAALPRYQPKDLEDEAFDVVKEAWGKFDPWKSAASTFVYTLAENTLIDLQDKAWNETRRNRNLSKEGLLSHEATLPHDLADREINQSLPLAEWLAAVCLAARRAYPDELRRQGRSYLFWQMIGFGVLMARQKLTPRCGRFMLLHRPDVRRVLNISKERVPSHQVLWRAAAMLKTVTHPVVGTAEKGGPEDEVGTPYFGEIQEEVGTERYAAVPA